MRIVDLIGRHDARHNLALALAAGVVVFFSLARLQFARAVIVSWDAFAVVILALDWLTIMSTPQHKIRERAQQEDLSRLVIFVFVVVASCAALFAVGFLVSVKKSQTEGHFIIHLLLTLLTVICSWTLVHTVFGLRYAHAFYGDSDDPGGQKHAGGLIFPGDRPPDYFDFAYFGFCGGNDLSGVGCANHVTPHALPHFGPKSSFVWIQHDHSRAGYQYCRLWSVVIRASLAGLSLGDKLLFGKG